MSLIGLRELVCASLLYLCHPAFHVAAGAELRIGLVPSEDSREMLSQSQKLLDILEQKLAIKVQAFMATDYNGVIEAMHSGRVEAPRSPKVIAISRPIPSTGTAVITATLSKQ